MEQQSLISPQGNFTGWSIQELLEDKNLLEAAETDWKESSIHRPNLLLTNSKEEDLDEEVD